MNMSGVKVYHVTTYPVYLHLVFFGCFHWVFVFLWSCHIVCWSWHVATSLALPVFFGCVLGFLLLVCLPSPELDFAADPGLSSKGSAVKPMNTSRKHRQGQKGNYMLTPAVLSTVSWFVCFVLSYLESPALCSWDAYCVWLDLLSFWFILHFENKIPSCWCLWTWVLHYSVD